METFFDRLGLRILIPAMLCFVGACVFVKFTTDLSDRLPATALYSAAAFLVCLVGVAIVLCYRHDAKREEHRQWLLSDAGVRHQLEENDRERYRLEQQLATDVDDPRRSAQSPNDAKTMADAITSRHVSV